MPRTPTGLSQADGSVTVTTRALIFWAPPRSTAEINSAINLIYDAILKTSDELLKKTGTKPARAARWWNDECKAATTLVKTALSGEDKIAAYKTLKTTIRSANGSGLTSTS